MALFSTLLDKLGIRLDKHDAEIAAVKAELTDTNGRLDAYEGRLEAMENSLENVILSFELKYQQLAQRTAGAREQRKKDLAAIRKEIDIFIEVVELSAGAQLDGARRKRVDKLLKTARAKRTRLANLISAKSANDAA